MSDWIVIQEDYWIHCDCEAIGCECSHVPTLDVAKMREHGIPVPSAQFILESPGARRSAIIEGFKA